MNWVRVTSVENVPLREGRAVRVGDDEIAIFNLGDRFVATENSCPHRGGPLAEGMLSQCIVTCPWHGWQFDVTTGALVQDPTTGVARHDARVVGDEIQVRLTE